MPDLNPRSRIYLDYNATAPIRPMAREAMGPWLAGQPANASSVHFHGREARKALETAREQVADALHGRASEVVFTSSATEANNLAIKGVACGPDGKVRKGLYCSAVEHPSVMEPFRWLRELDAGFLWQTIPVDGECCVVIEEVRRRLTGDALLVSISAANNETGTLAPIQEIAGYARGCGALLHVDATQVFGRLPVDVGVWGADLVTVSSHKVGGPSGAGALWIREGVQIDSLNHGGHQERNRRGGTENVAAAVGFGAACAEFLPTLADEAGRLSALRDELWSAIQNGVKGAVRLGSQTFCLPNTLNMAFPGVDGEAFLMLMDMEGVSISVGSACTAGSLDPSHVLIAMGIEPTLAKSAVRISLGWGTTPEEIQHLKMLVPALAEQTKI